jgi:hypothetical protein
VYSELLDFRSGKILEGALSGFGPAYYYLAIEDGFIYSLQGIGVKQFWVCDYLLPCSEQIIQHIIRFLNYALHS